MVSPYRCSTAGHHWHREKDPNFNRYAEKDGKQLRYAMLTCSCCGITQYHYIRHFKEIAPFLLNYPVLTIFPH